MVDEVKYRLVQYYFLAKLNWAREQIEEFYFPELVPYETLRLRLEDEADRLISDFGFSLKD